MTTLVRFWGTRGSIPTPGNKTRRYGGNTSCVEVNVDGTLFILDAGTGLRELGLALVEAQKESIEAHLLFSHTHWDHIQGFPFFLPAYRPTTLLNVYEIGRHDHRFTDLLLGQMRSEYFPVSFSDLGSQIVSRCFEEGFTTVNGVRLSVLEQNHPGRSFAHRLETKNRRMVYATDNELDLVLVNGDAVARDLDLMRVAPPAFVDFVRGAELLIADAQYSDEEYGEKRGWGHSRIHTVVDLAVQASVCRLALFHHDPLHADQQIDDLVELAKARAKHHGSALEVFAAREGMTLRVE